MRSLTFDLLIQGYPGASPSNGGMGWSAVGLVLAGDRAVLLDTGGFGARALLQRRLKERGLHPADITDLVLTHSHHDHCINWPMFTNARVYISQAELEWALTVPPGVTPVAELYVRELSRRSGVVLLDGTEEIIPGIVTMPAPGHTPGSVIVEVGTGAGQTIFAGDSAKNLSELVSRTADATLDATASASSIDMIWERWRKSPDSQLVPGHDLPMRLLTEGPRFVGSREASVQARLSQDPSDLTLFELS